MGESAVSRPIPPLPPGFVLDDQPAAAELPPLPPGFVIDEPPSPEVTAPAATAPAPLEAAEPPAAGPTWGENISGLAMDFLGIGPQRALKSIADTAALVSPLTAIELGLNALSPEAAKAVGKLNMPRRAAQGVSDFFQRGIDAGESLRPQAYSEARGEGFVETDDDGNISGLKAPSWQAVGGTVLESAAQLPFMIAGGSGLTGVASKALPATLARAAPIAGYGAANALMVAPTEADSVAREAYEAALENRLGALSFDGGTPTPEQIKQAEAMARTEAEQARAKALAMLTPLTAATGAAGQGLGAMFGRGAKSLPGAIARGALTDSPSEFVEEFGTSAAGDIAKGQDINLAQAINAGLLGMGAGALQGGTVGGYEYASRQGGSADAASPIPPELPLDPTADAADILEALKAAGIVPEAAPEQGGIPEPVAPAVGSQLEAAVSPSLGDQFAGAPIPKTQPAPSSVPPRGEMPAQDSSAAGQAAPNAEQALADDAKAEVLALREEIGWSERGGRLIRGGEVSNNPEDGASFGRASGDVVGRTKWVPKFRADGGGLSGFWSNRPNNITAKEAEVAFDKFERGEVLTPKQQEFIDYAKRTAQQYAQERAEAAEEFRAQEAARARQPRAPEPVAEDDIQAAIDRSFFEAPPAEEYDDVPFQRREAARASGIPAGLPATQTAASRLLAGKLNRYFAEQARRAGRRAPPELRFREIDQASLPDDARRALAALGEATGTRIVVVRNLTPEVDKFNGISFGDGVLYIDENADRPAVLVAAHEWVHQLRRDDPAAYQRLEDEVRRQGNLPAWIERMVAEGNKTDDDGATEELVADAVADAMIDPAFLRRVVEEGGALRRAARSFLRFLDGMLAKIKGRNTEAYMADVRAFRDELAAVLREYENRETAPTDSQMEADADAVERGNAASRATDEKAAPARQQRDDEEFDFDFGDEDLDLDFEPSKPAEGEADTRGRSARDSEFGAGRAPINTPNFRRWFRQSAVVDANGNPLPVYHGTGEEFAAFDSGRLATATGHASSGLGFYFTPDRASAESYAEKASGYVPADAVVLETYLSIQNPYVMSLEEAQAFEDAAEAKATRMRLEAQGYDGVHIPDQNAWVAFRANQVKRTDNLGTWNPNSDNMRLQRRSAASDDLFAKPTTRERGQAEQERRDAKRGADGAEDRSGDALTAAAPSFQRRDANPQTATPEFKRWFGESRVVDESGKPLVVYHGTAGSFDSFDTEKLGLVTNATSASKAFFFTDDANTAGDYAEFAGTAKVRQLVEKAEALERRNKWDEAEEVMREAEALEAQGPQGSNVLPVYLSIKNPLVFDAQGQRWQDVSSDLNKVIDRAKKSGYPSKAGAFDGVIIKNIIDDPMGRRPPSTHYAVFEPNQIKSAIGNRGTYNDSDNILQQRRSVPEAQAEAARKRATANSALGNPMDGGALGWNPSTGKWIGAEGALRKARESLQDKFISLRDLQQDIEKALGMPLPEAQNVYRLENLMHGRVQNEILGIDRRHLEPLFDAMRKAKVSHTELEAYLEARHAEERNKRIAKINPAMPDGGSGMTTAEARAALEKMDRAKLEPLAARIDAIVKETRRRLLDAGVITKAQYDAMEAAYKFYVPLRGIDPRTGEDESAEFAESDRKGGLGRGIEQRGSGIRRAAGRGAGNRAVNILGELIADAQRSVIAAEKARVGRALMRLVLANPNPNLWQVEAVRTERKFDAQGQVYEAIVNESAEPDVIHVLIQGQPYRIRIANPRLVNALKNIGANELHKILRPFAAMNRYVSATLTSYNPTFTLVNMSRDATFGSIRILAEHGPVIYAKTIAGYAPAIGALSMQEADSLGDGKMARRLREFLGAGAKTGWISSQAVEDLQRGVWLDTSGKLTAAGLRGARALFRFVESANVVVENAMRLAYFSALRDSGVSVEAAAEKAKDLTLNFNRKGSYSNAMSALYLFFNPAVQGSHQVAKLAKNPKVQAALAVMTAAQVVAAMLAAGLEDENGERLIDKVPEHVKERNLWFIIPGKRNKSGRLLDGEEDRLITLPMPFGFNAVTYSGTLGVELFTRDMPQIANGTKSANGVAIDVVSKFTDAFVGALSPIPMNDGLARIVPTVPGQAIAGLISNRDSLGRPIRQMQFDPGNPEPLAYSGKPQTAAPFVEVAKGLNWIGGGDEHRRPARVFDWAPEDIEYLFGWATGGAGRFLVETATGAFNLVADPDALKGRPAPLARAFTQPINDNGAALSSFFDRADAIEVAERKIRDVARKEGVEAAQDFADTIPFMRGIVVRERGDAFEIRPGSSDLYEAYKDAHKELRALRDEQRAIWAEEGTALFNSSRAAKLRDIRDRQAEAVNDALYLWNQVVWEGAE
jgi:hypothetical protein